MPVQSHEPANPLMRVDQRSFDVARQNEAEDGLSPAAFLAGRGGALALRLVEAATAAGDVSPSDAYLQGAADMLRIALAQLEVEQLEALFAADTLPTT